MQLPKVIIKEDIDLDVNTTLEFFESNPKIIQKTFPHFVNIEKIKAGYKDVYITNRKKYNNATGRLHTLIPTIEKIAGIISDILKIEWQKNTSVIIIPSVCPIAARFIENNTFLAPFFYYDKMFLHIAAHEMTHFLYFQYLKQSETNIIDTEFPSKDWLISEIVAPIVVNNKKIQDIIHSKDSLFVPDDFIVNEDKKIETERLFQQHGINFYDRAKKTWESR
jgi:hypothetical protein